MQSGPRRAWGFCEVQVDIVCDEQIDEAVAIVVQPRASGAPSLAGDRQTRKRGYIFEFAAGLRKAVESVVCNG